MITASDILAARILIVDDLPANVLLLEKILRGAGYTSITSSMDPSGVAELHRQNRYDLILLDLMMPGMNGFQVMSSLREIEADGYLPVLVITAQPGHKLHALEAGAKDFISKPFELPEVLARVHNMLEVRLLHQQTKRLYDELVLEHARSIELSAQAGIMVGVGREERVTTPWYASMKLRHPWLQFNLLTAMLAGGIMLIFHGTLDRLLILAVFVPVLISQTSNTGGQTLAITLRGIALGDLRSGMTRALIRKEALLGLLNGFLVGLVAAFTMWVVAQTMHLENALGLSAVVFLAMIGSCVISGVGGAIVPLVLRRCGADPATASSIVLTTITDVAALVLLMGLASVMVQ